MHNVGDRVYLRTNCGYSSLSGIAMWEHGVNDDTLVEVVATKENAYDYIVKLPDGYRLSVDERDVCSHPMQTTLLPREG